jgi:multidrug efflux pump subunit AcrA (membrane-fusion protein)
MFAKIKLIIETHKDVPAVLKEALIGKEPNLYVYIVENDKAHMKNAKVGIREGAYIEILEGIKDGDLVVIMGQQKLRDGASVITEMAEEDYSR